MRRVRTLREAEPTLLHRMWMNALIASDRRLEGWCAASIPNQEAPNCSYFCNRPIGHEGDHKLCARREDGTFDYNDAALTWKC